jgi:hypothetical protein
MTGTERPVFVQSPGRTGARNNLGSVASERQRHIAIEGLDTEKPRIIVQPKSTLTGPPRSATGSGTAHIELLPLPIDSNDCEGD